MDVLKKAPRESMRLLTIASNMEAMHDSGRGFLPTMINDALTNKTSNLYDALMDFKQAVRTNTVIDTDIDSEVTPDVRIGSKMLQDIYSALESNKIYDTAEPLMLLPSTQFALKRYLEPLLEIARKRNENEANAKRKAIWDAKSEEEKERDLQMLMNMMGAFNFEGGYKTMKRKTMKRKTLKRKTQRRKYHKRS
jgi:hypothetical protein